MLLLCVVPLQKYTFCCAGFGTTVALDLQQKLYILLRSKCHCHLFLEFIALSCSSEVLFVKFLAFFVGLFFRDIYIFMRDRFAALKNVV